MAINGCSPSAISRIEITHSESQILEKKAITMSRAYLWNEGAVVHKQPATERLQAVQLDNVALAPEFAEFLCDWTNIMHVRLDVLKDPCE